MSGYDYQKERASVFTEEGQKMFLSIRDRVKRLIVLAGAFTSGKAIAGETGSAWEMLACVDRLVELGEIVEVDPETRRWAQYRVFTAVGEL